MLIVLNIQHLIDLTKPKSNYDLANICGCVERILTCCYLMDCETVRYNPIRTSLSAREEALIHHEIKKVLPILTKIRDLNLTIYVDVGVNGSLILSTVKLDHGHHLFYTQIVPGVQES